VRDDPCHQRDEETSRGRSPAAPGGAGCGYNEGGHDEVVFFGARGTFEPFVVAQAGLGPTVFGVAERTRALLGAHRSMIRIEVRGVEYPATAWKYRRSCATGAASLNGCLTHAALHFPWQRFVLVGLSQGADVVRRALASTPEDIYCKVAAVVLLGDPTRKRSDPWDHGAKDAHAGILARRACEVSPGLYQKTWGYALEGDEVAANHHRVRGLFLSGSHTSYVHNRDGVQDRAAAFIVDRLLTGL